MCLKSVCLVGMLPFSWGAFQTLGLVKSWLTLKSSDTEVTFSVPVICSLELAGFHYQTLTFSLSPLSQKFISLLSLYQSPHESELISGDLLFAQTKILVSYSVTSLKTFFCPQKHKTTLSYSTSNKMFVAM